MTDRIKKGNNVIANNSYNEITMGPHFIEKSALIIHNSVLMATIFHNGHVWNTETKT